MKHKRHIIHHIHHKYRKHLFLFFVFLVVIGVFIGGYIVFRSTKHHPKLSPPLHIQGRIEKVTLPVIVIITEHPSARNSQVVEQKIYHVTIDPQKTIALKTLFLKATGPVEEKKEIQMNKIPDGSTIDCTIQMADATNILLSGVVTEVR